MGIETALIAGAIGSVGAAAMDNRSQRKAIQSAEEQRAASQKFIQDQIAQARGDIFKLFPAAQESRNQGFQAGQQILGQAYPQMQQAFQGGNVAAQNVLLAGLPQMQNAIRGLPVDLSGLQATQLPGMTFNQPQMNLPQMQDMGLAGQNQPQAQQMPPELMALMGRV